MPGISNVITLTDNTSPVLLGLITNLNATVTAMESLTLASVTMQNSLNAISGFTGLNFVINSANSASSAILNVGNAANRFNADLSNVGGSSALGVKIREFHNLETAIVESERIVRNLSSEMKALNSIRVNNSQFKSMANVVQYLNSEIDALQAELIQTGQYKVDSSSFTALRTTVAGVNSQIDIMQQNILQTGNYRLSGGEFPKMIETIMRANAELLRMQGTIERVDQRMDEVGANNGAVNNTKRWGQSLMEVYAKIQLIRMAFMAVSRAMNFADSYRTANARLSLANDGLQSNKELQQSIYESANRSRTDYRTTSNLVSRVALSGSTAFDNTEEIVGFSELVGKSLKIGGAGAQETDATMLQLSQALGSGKLQGDEYRSLMENAPYMMNMIAQGMEVPKGKLKELSKDGELTADAIVQALTKMSDNINSQFEGIPRTFGENMVISKNILGQWVAEMYETGGVLDILNNKFTEFSYWLQSDGGSAFLDSIETGLTVVINTLFLVIEAAIWFGNVIADNWVWIEPVIWTLVGAFTALLVIRLINTAMEAGKRVMDAYRSGTTLAMVAQKIFNSTLLANPMVWIVMGIAAAIALVIYALINWQEQTATVISYIGGGFTWLLAFIYNTFVMPLGNIILTVAEFVGNVFTDPISAVKQLFYNLCITVLEWLGGLIGAIESLVNVIPGVEINVSAKIDDFTNSIRAAKKELEDEKGLISVEKLNKWDYGEAFSMGKDKTYDLSLQASSGLRGLVDKIAGFSQPGADDGGGEPNYKGLTDALGDKEFKVTSDDKVDLSNESLKYLEEGVTQRFVNNVNLQAPAPNISVQFTGAIDRDVDVEKLAEVTKQKIGVEIMEGLMTSTNYAYSR